MTSNLAWETDSWDPETLETAFLSVLVLKFPGEADPLCSLRLRRLQGTLGAKNVTFSASRKMSAIVIIYKKVKNTGKHTSLTDHSQ